MVFLSDSDSKTTFSRHDCGQLIKKDQESKWLSRRKPNDEHDKTKLRRLTRFSITKSFFL